MAAESGEGLRTPLLAALARQARGVDGAVRDRAALEVADAVACMRLGASHPLVRQVAEAGTWQDPGGCESFAGRGVGIEEAVRLDALACHVDELDSIAPASAVVPGALVVPAALHIALHTGASGEDLLTAVVAGYDVVTLAGRALGGPGAYGHGWWPSSSVGALGAAAAAGVLLGLDEDRLAHALGLAAARTGGLLSDDHLGGGHYLSAADATVAGIRAALLAAGGLSASSTYLTGPGPRAIVSWRPVAAPPPGTGVLTTMTKPFPCARPLQGVVAALLASDLDLHDVAEVHVELPDPLLRFVSTDAEVPDATAAAASLAHVLAAARAGRATDARFFRAASLDGLAPMPSLRLLPLPGAPAGSWGCRVHLRTRTGEATTLTGEPPVVAPGDIRAKAARTLADAGVPADTSAAVLDDLVALRACPDVRDLLIHPRLRAKDGR